MGCILGALAAPTHVGSEGDSAHPCGQWQVWGVSLKAPELSGTYPATGDMQAGGADACKGRRLPGPLQSPCRYARTPPRHHLHSRVSNPGLASEEATQVGLAILIASRGVSTFGRRAWRGAGSDLVLGAASTRAASCYTSVAIGEGCLPGGVLDAVPCCPSLPLCATKLSTVALARCLAGFTPGKLARDIHRQLDCEMADEQLSAQAVKCLVALAGCTLLECFLNSPPFP